MIKYPLYLVPFDFSEISESALKLSLDLAEANNGSVYLLNVVKNKKQKVIVRDKFRQLFDTLEESQKELIFSNVIIGNPFEDIGKVADVLRPSLVVMGTKGAKGMQKVFGSHVEKILQNSSSPILVTQGKKELAKIRNIVMPFSFTRESLQVSRFAGDMAKKFFARIHIVGSRNMHGVHEDQFDLNKRNIVKLLEDNDIPHVIVDLPREKSFEEELLDYASEVDADVIAAAYTSDKLMPRPSSFLREMIENEYSIPVLTVNADEL